MARIRTIKPEFWSSPGVSRMGPWARLIFIAMWNWADDFGRGTYNPRELVGFVFPHDDNMTVGEFRTHVEEIRTHVDVKFYRVSGRDYYAIETWEKHQRIDKRLKGSKYPPPEDGTPINPENMQVEALAEESRTHVEEIRTHVEEEPGNRSVGTGEQGNRETTPLEPLDALARAWRLEAKAPDVYGTEDDPRCELHRDIPEAPPCHRCARARAWFEKNHTDTRSQQAEQRRQAIANCNHCDDLGWRLNTIPAVKCDHTQEEATCTTSPSPSTPKQDGWDTPTTVPPEEKPTTNPNPSPQPSSPEPSPTPGGNSTPSWENPQPPTTQRSSTRKTA